MTGSRTRSASSRSSCARPISRSSNIACSTGCDEEAPSEDNGALAHADHQPPAARRHQPPAGRRLARARAQGSAACAGAGRDAWHAGRRRAARSAQFAGDRPAARPDRQQSSAREAQLRPRRAPAIRNSSRCAPSCRSCRPARSRRWPTSPAAWPAKSRPRAARSRRCSARWSNCAMRSAARTRRRSACRPCRRRRAPRAASMKAS